MYIAIFFTIGLFIISFKVLFTGNLSNSLYGPEIILGDEKYIVAVIFLFFAVYYIKIIYKTYMQNKLNKMDD